MHARVADRAPPHASFYGWSVHMYGAKGDALESYEVWTHEEVLLEEVSERERERDREREREREWYVWYVWCVCVKSCLKWYRRCGYLGCQGKAPGHMRLPAAQAPPPCAE